MDLSLGGPVDAGYRAKDAKHAGNCTDSEFGCIKCHNLANDGNGAVSTCACGAQTYTHIVKAWDEPVLYEMCAECEAKNKPDDYDDDDGFEYDDSDVFDDYYPSDSDEFDRDEQEE